MPPALHELGRQDAHRAVVRGECLVQAGHRAADGALALDQIDLEAGVGQVQRGLDPPDPSAEYEHRSGGISRCHRRPSLLSDGVVASSMSRSREDKD